MSTLSVRIELVLKECALCLGREPQAALAKLAGTSNSVVSQWLSGGIKSMALKYALNIERNLGYNHIWLMIGSGAKETADKTNSSPSSVPGGVFSAEERALVYVDAYELRLLTAYKEATPFGRTVIEETARKQAKLPFAAHVGVAFLGNFPHKKD